MSFRIVSDSSSNILSLPGENYAAVPMKIIVGEKEYTDTAELDLQGMVDDLKKYKGKTGSSCPNVQEWIDAFDGADEVFCITITKNLSGSYNAAQQAAQVYMEDHPDKKVFIFDSLSAGPELPMIANQIRVLEAEGADFETVKEKVLDYHNHLHTIFCLESLANLARNGRVSPAVAKIAGVLNIRVVGEAHGGQIVPVHKPRGDKKAISAIVETMIQRGIYDGALVRISHCFAREKAAALKAALLEKLPNCRFIIEPTTALCSFYAEVGGMIVGYQGGFNTVNDNRLF